jgi:hypothetical protein
MSASEYFVVLDDVNLPNRWHLGSPFSGDTAEEVLPEAFIDGVPVDPLQNLVIPISRKGIPLDFTFADFDMPVVSSFVGAIFSGFGKEAIQRIPIRIQGGNQGGYEILNVTKKVRCIDERKTSVIKWTEADGEPGKVGQYRQIMNLRIDRTPAHGLHVFRVDGWEIALIISADLRKELMQREVSGVRYEPA